MPVDDDRRVPAGLSDRRILRAVVALSTATVLGTLGAGVAGAAPALVPNSSVASTQVAAAQSDADIEAIKQLKASYFQNVDAKNWEAVRALFAPDAVVDTRGSLGPIFYDRDSFIAFTRATLSVLDTHHEGYDPQITLTSPTTAEVVWTMQDRLVFMNFIGVHGYGHYTDRYEKVGDTWIVDRSRLTRTGITVIFPGLDNFVSVFAKTLGSEGPLAALGYAIRALLHVNPTSAAPAVQTAASTNATPTDVGSPVSTKSFARSAPTATGVAPAADPEQPKPAVSGTEASADVPAEELSEPVSTVDPVSIAAEGVPVAAEPKGTVNAKDDTEPKEPVEAKVDTEPKSPAAVKAGADTKDSAEAKDETTPKTAD